jgi:hypothetical protein
LRFIESPAFWGCCVCPVDAQKCGVRKRRDASRRVFDCYGALMRWLFWEDNEN